MDHLLKKKLWIEEGIKEKKLLVWLDYVLHLPRQIYCICGIILTGFSLCYQSPSVYGDGSDNIWDDDDEISFLTSQNMEDDYLCKYVWKKILLCILLHMFFVSAPWNRNGVQ